MYDPDFMLLQLRDGAYKNDLPQPGDVQLLIEAAESSLRRDQLVKLPVYAAAGIAEYWIANLNEETLLVHRQPSGKAYLQVHELRGDDFASLLALPDFSFAVRQAFD